jgi:UDP-glucose 4-epimerase
MAKVLLITGWTGYIWSHAVVAFEQAGYKTVIIDNLSNSSREVLSGIEKILGYCPDFFECDIRDSSWLEDIFRKYPFEGVIHFAGLKSVGESCKDIHQYQDNNVVGSIVLFWLMGRYGVRNIVFSSSATVYHRENISPLTEDMMTGTTNPYGTSKLIIEKLLEDYAFHADWSVVNLRYFNPIGAHPSGYIWEIPNGVPNNLLPYVLDVARWKREMVNVYWDDYDTPDGTWVRDYIDINDLIDAHLIAYEHIWKWAQVYNVWTGKGISVYELISMVESISKRDVPTRITEKRLWDLALVYADTSKIKNKLWWAAKREFTESIESAWNFISRRVE